ncbi:MAG: SURF1 family protein [Permianibacter sp.]
MLPTLLVLAFVLLTLNLGFWQLRREQQKLRLEADAVQAAAQAPVTLATALADDRPVRHRVLVEGHWQLPLMLLENQSWQGRRGWHALQWLQLPDGRLLLIDRGWTAQVVAELSGPASLTGQLYRPGRPWRAPVLDWQVTPVLVPVLDMPTLQQNDGRRLPWLLRLDGGQLASLQPNWSSSAGMTPAKHRGYAVTWFSLSAVLVLLYGWWLWQHRSVSPRKTSQHD